MEKTEIIITAVFDFPPENIDKIIETSKDLIDGGDCIVLNVQDGDSKIPGAYNATLGTLPFKACSGAGGFQDKMLTDNKTSKKFIVTCALGGQALLGAKL